jgi:RNA recognition motif-containing protein
LVVLDPTSFQLPDEVESTGDEETKDGDRPITEIKVPVVNRVRPEISEEAMKKLTSLKLNNLPQEITEEEVVKLLKECVKPDIESVNFEITRTPQRNTMVVVFSEDVIIKPKPTFRNKQ